MYSYITLLKKDAYALLALGKNDIRFPAVCVITTSKKRIIPAKRFFQMNFYESKKCILVE